ncbi:class I SAM-dependent DNA methyltransferase [Streptomyces sp. SID9727]|uniref:type I restriction-modification system subunit M n=1 Tax=Streptomyces sp. SID9727 TaxID=2706114 RepID=UPI0013CCE41B|nr:class I SAM-dependent DNA methyltransferase [Streptomyces sp. SID9727]NEC66296.1 SAM-dependent DNA methyltransferase [Streptomyces sp. SID9727]
MINFIWKVADLLRGDFRAHDYGKIILPFTVLRRLDCVLEPTKSDVLKEVVELEARGRQLAFREVKLREVAGHRFYNTSELTFKLIAKDPSQAMTLLKQYYGAFSENAREILDRYNFEQHISDLQDKGLLYQVVGAFAKIDLRLPKGPDDKDGIDNHQMGYIFEELIRKFSEDNPAGEHFTPREVVRLMVNLLLAPDEEALGGGKTRRVLDPACGTGGILSETQEHIKRQAPHVTVALFGQELNPESHAICQSDLLIKDQEPENIKYGNSFTQDGHRGEKFDYLVANPPFGVEWKKVKREVEQDARTGGRFHAGLPRISDGSFLFLQHMISKMKPVVPDGKGGFEGGSRIAIVFNGSPLFSGGAGSGESDIRRWILEEEDLLEAIVALPDQLFYNTGISTYFWILSNRKPSSLKGKVILLDARDQWTKMRKSLGDKRKVISDAQIAAVTDVYKEAVATAADPEQSLPDNVKIFDTKEFGYQRITVERPLKLRFEVTEETLAALRASAAIDKAVDAGAFADALKSLVGEQWATKAEAWDVICQCLVPAGLLMPTGKPFQKALRDVVGVRDPEGEKQYLKKGDPHPEPDPELRDNENVPLEEDIEAFTKREVLPHVPDAWVDHSKTKIGYEIPFTRQFYVYAPPRPLEEIDEELASLEAEIQRLLGQVTK